MKISKQKLKQIIKEEISNFQNYLSEQNELEEEDTYFDVLTNEIESLIQNVQYLKSE